MNRGSFIGSIAGLAVAAGLLTTVAAGCAGGGPAPGGEPFLVPIGSLQRFDLAEEESGPSPEVRRSLPVETMIFEGSGHTAWAEGYEGELIAGLDGNLYEPYHRRAILRVQRALRDRGVYAGPVNGVLDPPTMEAIYTLQAASYGLQRCGIPTPRTRELLAQGSHTL